jgi:cytochrome c oxidase assembly protein subunit 15
MTNATTQPTADTSTSNDARYIRIWLFIVGVMIFAMVIVGGATRLTDSGLSITEWKPIHGAIPPLSEADWQEEFEKYQKIPEFKEVNNSMNLEEFKFIFWWEWGHRLLGRVIGLVVAIPLAIFLLRRRVPAGLTPRLIGLLVLGGLQGAVGWWMVSSGLTKRVDVSQYRLAVHLILACILFAWVVWEWSRLSTLQERAGAAVRQMASLLIALIFVQIYLGALVAGLDAGFSWNSWPLMAGKIIPDGLWSTDPWWLANFEDHLTVQFLHRIGAYVLLVVAFINLLLIRRPDGNFRSQAVVMAAVVTLQALIGIVTLLWVVPLPTALLHQAGALIVLALATHQRATIAQ